MSDDHPPPIIARIQPLDNGTYRAIVYLENIVLWRRSAYPNLFAAQTASIAAMLMFAKMKPTSN